MHRLIGIVLGGWLLLAGVAFAAEEQIVTELTGNVLGRLDHLL